MELAIAAFSMRYFFTEMFIEKSSSFYMNFVQIVSFDWLPVRHKGLIIEKIFKKNFPETISYLRSYEATTLHVCY